MPLVTRTDNTGLTEEQIKNIVKQTVKEISNKQIGDAAKITVFVSHKFKERDIKFAKKLQDKLKEYGIDGYLAEHKKEYGYIISNKIKDAIRDSICVVVILTNDSISSPSVNQELGYAMGIGMNIIPMVHEEVSGKVGVLLKGVEGEEFNEKNFEAKCERITKYIVSELEKLKPSTAVGTDEEKFSSERADF